MIGTIIVINAAIGIFQERKAQASLEALKNMGAQVSRVMREGEESVISAGELVVGDIVLLSDGDMVPADIRLIDSANLKVQEASLTGESVPSEKDADEIFEENCPLGDRSNIKKLTDLVGNTPLMELSGYSGKYGLEQNIIAKLEAFNPAGSVKDRVALSMIEDAEARGALKPGATPLCVGPGATTLRLSYRAD